MGNPNERTALVTGGNRGIGFAVARGLAQRGLHVFLGARRVQDGEQGVEALRREGLVASFVALDVADETSIQEAARAVAKQVDHLDVLVNNAGILLDEEKTVLELDAETFSKTLQTNALGPLLVTQAFFKLLKASRQPRVINVSSGAGSLSQMGTYAPAYSISKAALNAVTRQLAGALPGVAVNSVSPGWVRTAMGGENAPRSVEEGADTILWLATEASTKTTGQFISDRKPVAW